MDAWDPRATQTGLRAVFAEFGRWRWLTVPLGALAIAALVWLVGLLAGGTVAG